MSRPQGGRDRQQAAGKSLRWGAMSRRRTGFTLIEMIVATLLLAIGVAGAMTALASSTRASAFAQEVDTAALLAQRQFTQLQLQPQSLTGGEQQGDFSPDYPGYRWQQSVETTDYTNLYQVTLTILWGSSASPHTRVFTTYMNVNAQQNGSGQPQNSGGTPGIGGGQAGGTNGG